MRDERKEPSAAARAMAGAEIERLIQNPRLRAPSDPAKRWPESENAHAIGSKAVQQLRELACRRTGMTMAQLLAAEAAVNHPREFLDVRQMPRVMARSRMKSAGVPERFILHVADKEPIACLPFKRVQTFLQERHGFLMLAGGKGVYKTGSASWALGQVDDGAFLDVAAIIRLSISDRPAWERVLAAPVVVLDDLGTEKRVSVAEQAAFVTAFHELFNSTYSHCRRMILTGNISQQEFKAAPEQGGYGERVADRFREAGVWFDVVGESKRAAMRAPSHWSDGDDGSDE